LTRRTISATRSRSRSLGERQAAPMQKRLAPPSRALRAAATTSSTSMRGCSSTGDSWRTLWGQ